MFLNKTKNIPQRGHNIVYPHYGNPRNWTDTNPDPSQPRPSSTIVINKEMAKAHEHHHENHGHHYGHQRIVYPNYGDPRHWTETNPDPSKPRPMKINIK